MTKGEILEKLKDFKDTDEIIFLKKEEHYVPAPEDSWDEDIVYSTTTVQVDDMTVDTQQNKICRF